jgi:hypothetical protein
MTTTLDLNDVDTEIDTSILEDLDFDVPCMARGEEHPAAWDVSLTCGCHCFVCPKHLKAVQIMFREGELMELLTGNPAIMCTQCGADGIGIAMIEPIKPGKGHDGN